MNVYNERGNQHIVGTCSCVILEGGRDGGKMGGRERRGVLCLVYGGGI